MRICITAEGGGGSGQAARVYGHFGSAPCFVIYDTEARSFGVVDNSGRQHEHGQCNPLQALAQQSVDVLVTGGIGARALQMLGRQGIRAFRAAEAHTAAEAVERFQAGLLPEIAPGDACTHHDHGEAGASPLPMA
jgi:predicted Fe-Mo cluster-binding NifX family protein